MLEFLVINLPIFLPIKVSQFIHIVVKKKIMMMYGFHYFEGKFSKAFLSWWLYHTTTKFPFQKFYDFIVLLNFSFEGLMGFQLLIFSNSTIFKKKFVLQYFYSQPMPFCYAKGHYFIFDG